MGPPKCNQLEMVTTFTYKPISVRISLSPRFNGHFPREPGLAGVYWSKGWWRRWWQLDYWSYKSCKAPVNHHHQQTNIQFFLQAGCPSCHPTNSVKALKGRFGEDLCMQFRVIVVTDPQTNKHRHRHDWLQYTAPQLAHSVIIPVKGNKHNTGGGRLFYIGY